jgi:glyoxylase-like metal-dependent hydrolase (beta-lactamase superfamily II)
MKRLPGVAILCGFAVAASAQVPRGGVEVLQLRSNFYMIAGAGGNVAVQTGDDGVVVVDTGSAAGAGAILEAIQKITTAPIRYIINTGPDPDHVGGNEIIAKAGLTLFGTRSTGLPDTFRGSTAASILAAEKVLTRMSAPTGQKSPYPFAAWPTETFDYERRYMFMNGEAIEIFHQPAAHTDGDSLVFFRRSDVLVAGDVFDADRFPVIDVARGGSVQGELAALNKIISIAVPSVPFAAREAGTLVIPGHGHLVDQYSVVDYRDMVSIVRDHVADLIKNGRTLPQIQAAAPAKGYSPRYGSDSGPWTTNAFIEAIYQSLTAPKS